jgi:hypothetical protein
MNTESKPTSSAVQEKSSNWLGPNCSADALYPILSNPRSYQSNYGIVAGYGSSSLGYASRVTAVPVRTKMF